MPSYDYVCLNCKKKFSLFFRYEEYGKVKVVCPHCESDLVRRKIGRIRIAHSASSSMEDLSDPQNLDALEDDPRALGRMMRQMSEETGEDMGPEFDEVVNRLEKGQHPEQIEQEIPDLLGDESSPGGQPDLDDDF
jgi:putative FmdB family regulatory protein